jgi:hypothetical protein
MSVRRILPDFTFRGQSSTADLSIEVKGRDFPLGSETLLDTAEIESNTGQFHIRARTREAIIKISSSALGYGWTLGDLRFDIRTDGKR